MQGAPFAVEMPGSPRSSSPRSGFSFSRDAATNEARQAGSTAALTAMRRPDAFRCKGLIEEASIRFRVALFHGVQSGVALEQYLLRPCWLSNPRGLSGPAFCWSPWVRRWWPVPRPN